MPTPAGWPELLALLRANARMSRNAAAEAIGVRRMQVYRWETGAQVPSPDVLERVREVYKPTQADWLPLVMQWQLAWQDCINKRAAVGRSRRTDACKV